LSILPDLRGAFDGRPALSAVAGLCERRTRVFTRTRKQGDIAKASRRALR